MTVDDITSDLLPSVNLAQLASMLESAQTVDRNLLVKVGTALRQLNTAVTKIQTVLKQLESPTWLPQLRLGYPEDNPPFYVDDRGYLRIQGNADITGTVSATSFKLRQLNVLDLVLTNNAPTAGKITWSACRVVYDGVVTNIPTGNTIDKFVYWDVGDSTFTTADSFTPQIDRFLVATNDNGVADEAWNKIAGKAIQKSNIMFSLLESLQPTAYDYGQVDLTTALDTVTIVDTTGSPGAGVLLAFSVHIVALPGALANGDVSLFLEIDGSVSAYNVPVFSLNKFDEFTKTMRSDGTGAGDAAGDWFCVQVPISYQVSIKAQLVWIRTSPGTGTIGARLWRAVKV